MTEERTAAADQPDRAPRPGAKGAPAPDAAIRAGMRAISKRDLVEGVLRSAARPPVSPDRPRGCRE